MSDPEATRREDSSSSSPPGRRALDLNEHWAATILGLLLPVLVLTGVIPVGLVP